MPGPPLRPAATGDPAPPAADRALHDHVLDQMDRWAAALPPRLAAAWAGLSRHLALRAPADPYFLHPMALPVVQLPRWVARRFGPVPPQQVTLAAQSAIAGYLYVRLRDDQLDEGVVPDPATLLLSDHLRALHLDLLAQVGGEGMRAAARDRWVAFSEAMLTEAELRASGAPIDPPTFTALLDRARPIDLPARAVLRAAGATADLAPLLEPLLAAHQTYNDLVDLPRDLDAGARTRLLDRAGAPQGRAAAFRWLTLGGGLDVVVGEIFAQLDAATAAAAALTLPGASAWLSGRRTHVEAMRQRTWAAMLGPVLGISPP